MWCREHDWFRFGPGWTESMISLVPISTIATGATLALVPFSRIQSFHWSNPPARVLRHQDPREEANDGFLSEEVAHLRGY